MTISICGAGHSGSTLLGLALGSHANAFYAGEAKKTLFIGDAKKPLRKRVCKICGEGCTLWSRFQPPPTPDLYEALSRLSGRAVIIDSTKKPSWIEERARELSEAGAVHKLIFLTRDGRAVVNSRYRKYGAERSALEIVQHWAGQIRATQALLPTLEAESMTLAYEELATTPEPVLRRVCDFLGLEFQESMLHYERQVHHPLGGNTGTQSVVARAQGIEGEHAQVPSRSAGYYGGLSGGFRLDLRWESELPSEVLSVFEEEAGVLNEDYRWPR